jgi:hypothetical protein
MEIDQDPSGGAVRSPGSPEEGETIRPVEALFKEARSHAVKAIGCRL